MKRFCNPLQLQKQTFPCELKSISKKSLSLRIFWGNFLSCNKTNNTFIQIKMKINLKWYFWRAFKRNFPCYQLIQKPKKNKVINQWKFENKTYLSKHSHVENCFLLLKQLSERLLDVRKMIIKPQLCEK